MDARIADWLSRDPDSQTRKELQDLVERGDQEELNRRFAGRLTFGTAGLRGLVGAGPSRMNRLVVRQTAAGLGRYLLACSRDAAGRGVVVAFDARRGSRIFAEDAACVLGAMGIKVHLFEREMPTPIAAFAVRHLSAVAGVVVTASHNPPDYNGTKVYGSNGAQIIAPRDRQIAEAIDEAAGAPLPWRDAAALRREKTIVPVGENLAQRYLDGVRKLSVHPPTPRRAQLKIAYTPLHGVGAPWAEAALRRAGFTAVHTVPSQREPDGSFPTVPFPNPEEAGAMQAVIALAQHVGASLACANDPDADRLAVAVARPDGSFQRLTGNEIGVLLADDLLRKAGKRDFVATTLVSSRLLGRMAKALQVGYFETLTGFKWLANQALENAAGGGRLIFAYEEALGFCVGDLVADKDGISALVVFAELACACAADGQTVWDRLESLYRRHGLFATAQKTLQLSSGSQNLGALLRQHVPKTVGGQSVVRVHDLLQNSASEHVGGNAADEYALPQSDVLVFYLASTARVIVRPSGTEPKIKCYYEVIEAIVPNEAFAQAQKRAQTALLSLMDAHQIELAKIMNAQ